MDMELSEQQKKLIDTACRFMENECPLSAVREMESTETGFSLDLWQKMGALGWLGARVPGAVRRLRPRQCRSGAAEQGVGAGTLPEPVHPVCCPRGRRYSGRRERGTEASVTATHRPRAAR